MSQSVAQQEIIRSTAAKFGALVAVFAAACVVYGAYGDPTASQSQRSAVPVVLTIALVGTAIVFGLLVPAGLRAIAAHSTATRWSLGHAIAGLLLVPVFWTGLPLILGAGALVLAANQRREFGPGRATAVALGLGWFLAAGTVIWTIVSNVVLSR